jgi:hypothetical protein
MAASEVKEGALFQERDKTAKHPRIVRIKKVTNIGPNPYVYYMAENPAAQAIHPNGGMIPLAGFLDVWAPVKG